MTKTLKRCSALAVALLAATAARAATDSFGVTQVYPTASGGKNWSSKWSTSRTFTGIDPADAWFNANHGDARYVAGGGLLKISGSTPRMYIHDPAKQSQWRDTEMTVYAMRVSDDGTAYAGIVGVSRTNHGTTGSETANLCDTRGYGSRVRNDGKIDFDKETSHPTAIGVASKSMFSGGLPKNRWIGYKFVTYDLPNGNVKLETFIDQTDGAGGGNWVKVNSFEDNGANMGIGGRGCKSGISPLLKLRNGARTGSESGKPNISVYFRSTNVGTNGLVYKKMSVREITVGGTTAPTTPTAGAPVATGVKATEIAATGAKILWTTDKVSHSQVEYGLTSAYGLKTAMSAATGLSHSMGMTGLQAGKTYHYRVLSKDDVTGLTGVSANFTFATTGGAAAPVTTNVKVSGLLGTSATITWQTDKVSHSQVEYGPTSAYGLKSGMSTATGLYHSTTLTGLQPGTTYRFRTLSLDDATKLTGVSTEFSFTTPGTAVAAGPVTTNVVVAGITSSGASITWTTDKVSHSQVEYGLTSTFGSMSAQSLDTGLGHKVTLAGLQAGKTYRFRTRSLDPVSKLTGVSQELSFTTSGGTAAPTTAVITNVQAAGITSSGANITWTTTTNSHSQVEYGLTSAYGSQTYQSTATGLYHSMPLAGLKPATTYHYRVKSRNPATGTTDVSGNFTFKTSGTSTTAAK